MNRCPKCNVYLYTPSDTCPLCSCVPEEMDAASEAEAKALFGEGAPYPNALKRRKFTVLALKIILFVFAVTEVVLIFINRYTTPHIWWSAITAAAFLYCFLFLLYWVQHDSGFAAKVGLQLIFTMVLLYVIDYTTGSHGWALKWAIPGCILFGDGIVLFLMMLNRSRWASYILLLMFMGLCSVAITAILYFTKTGGMLLAAIAIAVTGIHILGAFVFGERAVARELGRRFHV